MKKIDFEYYNVSEKDKEEIKKEFIEEREKYTEHFREQNDHEGFDTLEKIAQEAGFEKLLIDPVRNEIYTEIVLGDSYVFYPENSVLNHQRLAEIDKDFTDKMAMIVMLHEFEHHNNPSKEASIKRVEGLIKTIREAESGNLSDKEMEKFFLVESQTHIQMITKNPDKFDDTIDALAGLAVYYRTISHGICELETKSLTDSPLYKSYRFLNKNAFSEIFKKEIKIQKELIKKFNKLAKDFGEKISLSDKDLI